MCVSMDSQEMLGHKRLPLSVSNDSTCLSFGGFSASSIDSFPFALEEFSFRCCSSLTSLCVDCNRISHFTP